MRDHEYGTVDDCLRCIWCECLPGTPGPCDANPADVAGQPRRQPRALIVRPDNTIEVRPVTGLDDLQALVGGYIESVSGHWDLTFYVNEEGLLRGLPPNDLIGYVFGVMILGTAVLLGAGDDEGWETDVPDEIVERFTGALKAVRA